MQLFCFLVKGPKSGDVDASKAQTSYYMLEIFNESLYGWTKMINL